MRVEITTNTMGRGSIKVDGVDLSNVVQGVEIVTRAGSPTNVRLILTPCELKLDAETEAKLIEIER